MPTGTEVLLMITTGVKNPTFEKFFTRYTCRKNPEIPMPRFSKIRLFMKISG